MTRAYFIDPTVGSFFTPATVSLNVQRFPIAEVPGGSSLNFLEKDVVNVTDSGQQTARKLSSRRQWILPYLVNEATLQFFRALHRSVGGRSLPFYFIEDVDDSFTLRPLTAEAYQSQDLQSDLEGSDLASLYTPTPLVNAPFAVGRNISDQTSAANEYLIDTLGRLAGWGDQFVEITVDDVLFLGGHFAAGGIVSVGLAGRCNGIYPDIFGYYAKLSAGGFGGPPGTIVSSSNWETGIYTGNGGSGNLARSAQASGSLSGSYAGRYRLEITGYRPVTLALYLVIDPADRSTWTLISSTSHDWGSSLATLAEFGAPGYDGGNAADGNGGSVPHSYVDWGADIAGQLGIVGTITDPFAILSHHGSLVRKEQNFSPVALTQPQVAAGQKNALYTYTLQLVEEPPTIYLGGTAPARSTVLKLPYTSPTARYAMFLLSNFPAPTGPFTQATVFLTLEFLNHGNTHFPHVDADLFPVHTTTPGSGGSLGIFRSGAPSGDIPTTTYSVVVSPGSFPGANSLWVRCYLWGSTDLSFNPSAELRVADCRIEYT